MTPMWRSCGAGRAISQDSPVGSKAGIGGWRAGPPPQWSCGRQHRGLVMVRRLDYPTGPEPAHGPGTGWPAGRNRGQARAPAPGPGSEPAADGPVRPVVLVAGGHALPRWPPAGIPATGRRAGCRSSTGCSPTPRAGRSRCGSSPGPPACAVPNSRIAADQRLCAGYAALRYSLIRPPTTGRCPIRAVTSTTRPGWWSRGSCRRLWCGPWLL